MNAKGRRGRELVLAASIVMFFAATAAASDVRFALGSDIEKRFSSDGPRGGITQPTCSACTSTPVEQMIEQGFAAERASRFQAGLPFPLPSQAHMSFLITDPNALRYWPQEVVQQSSPTPVEKMIERGFPSDVGVDHPRWDMPEPPLNPVFSSSIAFVR